VLNWYGVCKQGEVLHGPPPLELGPALSEADYRRVVSAQLAIWQDEVREPWPGYVPAARGYAVVTICRALYALETGGQTTKEAAAAWAAGRFPEWAEFVRESLADHRADPSGPHAATIRFADFAVEAARS
jgi:hypothetical protein